MVSVDVKHHVYLLYSTTYLQLESVPIVSARNEYILGLMAALSRDGFIVHAPSPRVHCSIQACKFVFVFFFCFKLKELGEPRPNCVF